MSLIRGTSLTGFPELVRTLGGAEPDELLRRNSIPRTAVGDFDSFVDYVGLLRLLEDAARETRTPGFGRQLADLQGIEILGVVGAAARTAGTVRHAVAIIARYLGALAYVLAREPGSRRAYGWLWQRRREILRRRRLIQGRRTAPRWALDRWFFRQALEL